MVINKNLTYLNTFDLLKMKFTITATTLSVALASAFPQKNAQVAMPDDIHAWHPAGINDRMSPCHP